MNNYSLDLPPSTPALTAAENAAVIAAKTSMTAAEWRASPERSAAITSNIPLVGLVVQRSRCLPRSVDPLASHLLVQLVESVDNIKAGMGAKISTYLYRCLRFQAVDFERRHESMIHVPQNAFNGKNSRGEAQDPEKVAAAVVAVRTVLSSDADPEGWMVVTDWAEGGRYLPPEDREGMPLNFREAIDSLPPAHAEAVRTRYGLDRPQASCAETARETGVSLHVVRDRLYTAQRMLKKRFQF